MGGLKYSNLFRESNFAIHVSSKTYFITIYRIEIRGNRLAVRCLACSTYWNERILDCYKFDNNFIKQSRLKI
jgi:hypothetical protein